MQRCQCGGDFDVLNQNFPFAFIKILLCIVLGTVIGCASRNITLNPTSEAKSKPPLFADDHKKCSRLYYSNTTWVLEVHCDVNSIMCWRDIYSIGGFYRNLVISRMPKKYMALCLGQ